jgi:hypothetical protein
MKNSLPTFTISLGTRISHPLNIGMTDTDERIANAVEELYASLSALVDSAINQFGAEFPDNPSIPYTVVLDTLGAGIGQLINMFPEGARNEMLHHVVKLIVKSQHVTAKHHTPLVHNRFGHA